MITWLAILRDKTQCTFLNIFNFVKWTVIEIWYYKWFINGHTTFVVMNIFLRRRKTSSCRPAFTQTSKICSVKFILSSISILKNFMLPVEDTIALLTFIIEPSTSQPWDEISIDWNFSALVFKECCLNYFIKTKMSFVKNFRMSSTVSLE